MFTYRYTLYEAFGALRLTWPPICVSVLLAAPFGRHHQSFWELSQQNQGFRVTITNWNKMFIALRVFYFHQVNIQVIFFSGTFHERSHLDISSLRNTYIIITRYRRILSQLKLWLFSIKRFKSLANYKNTYYEYLHF